MAIKFQDNTPQAVTFKYGNVSRCKSKQDGGGYYYRFDTEDDRMNANPHLAAAIAANWPGRGGTVSIEKFNNKRWDVAVVEPADRIYPLEMREWSEDAHEFEEVDFVIYGADDPVPEGREHKPDETPKKQPPAETPKPATPKPGAVASFGDMEQLMLLCCQSAEKTCPDSYTSMDKQKIAVTMFMQCDKRGITAEAIAAELVEKEFDTEPVETKEPQDDTEDGLPF